MTDYVTLAGGCFWCTEAVFKDVIGVESAESGYIGGHVPDPTYKQVCGGDTGHAEAIRIGFDPEQLKLGDLLDIFFATHDPTQLNRQGPDNGPSYRSALFPQDARQAAVARAYIAQLGAAKSFPRPIVTRIEQGGFFPAEAYHQNFYDRNPTHPYIVHWDKPKVAAFRAGFPTLYR